MRGPAAHGLSSGVLRSLRRALADGGPPAVVAAGLREAVLVTYASQLVAGGLAALIAALALQSAPEPRGWALVLLVVSAVSFAALTALARQAHDLPSAVSAAVLLATGAAVPGLLGLLLATLEGPAGDAWMLAAASFGLLVSALGRATGLAARASGTPPSNS